MDEPTNSTKNGLALLDERSGRFTMIVSQSPSW